MKKNVIAGAMLAIAVIFGSSSAFAQDQNKCEKQCTSKEQCNRGPKEGKQAFNPFEGLNLTPEQQTRLDALKAECKAAKADIKKDAAQKKEQVKKEARQGRNEMKAQMLQKVKAILTPEQYVQFLENAFVNNGNGPRMKHDKQAMHNGHKNSKNPKACKGHNGKQESKPEKKN